MEMDNEFLDIFVLTAQENLLRYLQEFKYDDDKPLDSSIEQLMLDISSSRDILLALYVKKRTPQVEFDEIRTSANELISFDALFSK